MVMNSGTRQAGTAEELVRTTPVKRRRLLPLVDLRNPGCGTNLHKDIANPSAEFCHVMEFSGSSSVGSGRRSRPALTDLTKSGFCGIVECGELTEGSKTSTLGSAKVLTKGISDPKDGTVSRFPRLDQCAHFHYEFVELPPIQVVLVNEDLKPLSQSAACEDIENKSLLVQVTSLGRSWVVRRTYDNFRFLDKQLHRCCYDRKISHLQELPPEENLPRVDEENCAESLLEKYLYRLSDIAGSLITCGPVLGWLELDNRGHRLIVTDDSDINTPAVAAAYVVKRYTAQASDEISFEVGDMISVIDMPPPEESIWWRGKRGFQVGFFPCECVQVIEGKVPQGIHPQGLTLPARRSSSDAHAHSSLHAVHSFSTTQEPMKPVLRKHGKLIAFFRSELVEESFRSFILSRPPRPWLKRSGILRERVFGCDLAEHLLNSGHDIPMVLKCCAEFIETHGTVDGIYRLSGITSNIQKLRNAFDEERVPALYEDESILQDIHCVSSVLKMYFRELPNPLLTYQLYAKFSLAVVQDEGVRLLHIRDVVQQLPPPHYRTLEYLIRHLARVASFSSTTGMTPKNIAIVWAPNLLRSKDLERGGVAALQDVGTQAVVTEYLVRYVDLIFNDKIPNFSPSSVASDRLQRPKSLAISTPVKLLSIDEARNRSLAVIKTDQNYIDVGGGPNSLPKTYHTVIDIRNRKGGSLKQKKSPLGWKTFFWKNKHQQKKNFADNLSNISDSIGNSEGDEQPIKRLRPTKSVESLSSSAAQLHSKDNDPVVAQDSKILRNLPFIEMDKSMSSLSSPSPSSRTHSRSVSHNSYFHLLEKGISSKINKNYSESDSSASPKFDLELKELEVEFKLSESDIRIFSEDDTLQSTSMDTASRTTLDAEGISLRSGRSPSAHHGRISRPLKRNLLRSSSEDFKCVSLSPSEVAGPDKQYRSSGNLPKYAKLNSDAKRCPAPCDSEARSEIPSDSDKSPCRASFDSALIEPDLLERITRMRTSSVEGSVVSSSDESMSNDVIIIGNTLEHKVQTSITAEDSVTSPAANEIPFPTGAAQADILIPVDVHFQRSPNTPIQYSTELPEKPRHSYISGAPDFPSPVLSPETPQSDMNFGEIRYDPLSDTTELSTPSGSEKPDSTNRICLHSQNVSSDSLSSQYETILVGSPECDTPVPDKSPELCFPSEVKYETLCDNSPGDAELGQNEPQYINVDSSVLQDSTIQESNYYENIEPLCQSNIDNEETEDPNYENCEFVNGRAATGPNTASVEDQSVYQQVKYLRKSIQEVNEILNDKSPPMKEKRKSITKMTIHFSKIAVSNTSPQVSPDHVDRNVEISETPHPYSIIKEISLTELPLSDGEQFSRAETEKPSKQGDSVDNLPAIPEQNKTLERNSINVEHSTPFDSVGPIPHFEQGPKSSIKNLDPEEPNKDLKFKELIKNLDPEKPIENLESEEPSKNFHPEEPITNFEAEQPMSIAVSSTKSVGSIPYKPFVVQPDRPIPLPRSNFENGKPPSAADRTFGLRSLTPPSQITAAFQHPSTSLPAELAGNSSHDGNQTKTWPPSDQHRKIVCGPKDEDDTQKRERINKYKEERRSVLRMNYHPSSFKGEKDEMLARLKQKASNPFRNQDADNSQFIFGEESPGDISDTQEPTVQKDVYIHDSKTSISMEVDSVSMIDLQLESCEKKRLNDVTSHTHRNIPKAYAKTGKKTNSKPEDGSPKADIRTGRKDSTDVSPTPEIRTVRNTSTEHVSPKEEIRIGRKSSGDISAKPEAITTGRNCNTKMETISPKLEVGTGRNANTKPEDISRKDEVKTSRKSNTKQEDSSPKLGVRTGRTNSAPDEVTVKERVAIWAQQEACDVPKLKPVCTKPATNPLPKSSPIVIQNVKDRGGLNPVYNNGVDNHRPCVKSQSSDSIPRSCPAVLPLKLDISSRRASDVGRKIAVGGVTLKSTRKIQAFDTAKITGSIGQEKIRAIAAQFEPEVNPVTKGYLRQISK